MNVNDMKKSSTSSRFDKNIRKVFALVPLIYNNQGITINELIRLGGYKNRTELQNDMDRLLMFGIPPYSPSDFILLTIEEDKVFLDFPHGLERPLDLNSREWSVLQKIIQADRDYQTTNTINSVIADDLLQKITSIPLMVSNAGFYTMQKNLIKEALEDQLQINFLYSSLSSKEPELRRIDPWVIFDHKKSSYVMGFCHTRMEPRSFLLDRMMEIEILDLGIKMVCPQNITQVILKTSIFDTSPMGFLVKLAFHKSLTRHLKLILDIENIESLKKTKHIHNSDIWLQGSAKVRSSLWLLEIVAGLGDSIIILEPEFLREKLCDKLNNLTIPESIKNDS